MNKLYYFFAIGLLYLLFGTGLVYAQSNTMDDVRLFQSFFRDAPIATNPYAEALGSYSSVPLGSNLQAGVQGGVGLTDDIEITTGLYYRSFNPDNFDSETGIIDIPVYGRYNFLNGETKISGGAYVTLPVGSEALGEENTNYGIFGAVRHPASEQVVITGTLGIDLLDFGLDREASLNLGAGVIYASSDELSIIGELTIQSEIDYSALSGGVDYKLKDIARLRANLLLGLDDGAPDYGLTAGILVIL